MWYRSSSPSRSPEPLALVVVTASSLMAVGTGHRDESEPIAARSARLLEHEVRHTRSVLHDYGNISSGSFLVSLERLLAEGVAARGDRGIMLTMGPGAQIEAALLEL